MVFGNNGCSDRGVPLYIVILADKMILERVQRRAVRLSPRFKNLSNRKRLHNLGLTTLERMRERDDLIQWYNINTQIDKVTWYTGQIIKAARDVHRQSQCKETKLKFAQKTKFLINRVANRWNDLNDPTV